MGVENARRIALALTLIVANAAIQTDAAPVSESTDLETYDDEGVGCYYNFQHYGEGDRIMTNEPCLNCTCHNRMLMCYLRVCPFTKPIGQDCTVEKRGDQCCPIITCPDVRVDLVDSTTISSVDSTEVGHHDKYGCSINNKFYADGAQVPSNPGKPCELCYCIRNMTACLMQECTLHVEGCTPVYQRGVCCPVRYSCDHPEDDGPLMIEDATTTTARPTPGYILTTTVQPGFTSECTHNELIYADGALIPTEHACEHCYCMKGDIVCAVQECGTPMENEGKNCTAIAPKADQCCPDTYICEGDEATTTASPVTDSLETDLTKDHPISSDEDKSSTVPPQIPEDHKQETVQPHVSSTPVSEDQVTTAPQITVDGKKTATEPPQATLDESVDISQKPIDDLSHTPEEKSTIEPQTEKDHVITVTPQATDDDKATTASPISLDEKVTSELPQEEDKTEKDLSKKPDDKEFEPQVPEDKEPATVSPQSLDKDHTSVESTESPDEKVSTVTPDSSVFRDKTPEVPKDDKLAEATSTVQTPAHDEESTTIGVQVTEKQQPEKSDLSSSTQTSVEFTTSEDTTFKHHDETSTRMTLDKIPQHRDDVSAELDQRPEISTSTPFASVSSTVSDDHQESEKPNDHTEPESTTESKEEDVIVTEIPIKSDQEPVAMDHVTESRIPSESSPHPSEQPDDDKSITTSSPKSDDQELDQFPDQHIISDEYDQHPDKIPDVTAKPEILVPKTQTTKSIDTTSAIDQEHVTEPSLISPDSTKEGDSGKDEEHSTEVTKEESPKDSTKPEITTLEPTDEESTYLKPDHDIHVPVTDSHEESSGDGIPEDGHKDENVSEEGSGEKVDATKPSDKPIKRVEDKPDSQEVGADKKVMDIIPDISHEFDSTEDSSTEDSSHKPSEPSQRQTTVQPVRETTSLVEESDKPTDHEKPVDDIVKDSSTPIVYHESPTTSAPLDRTDSTSTSQSDEDKLDEIFTDDEKKQPEPDSTQKPDFSVFDDADKTKPQDSLHDRVSEYDSSEKTDQTTLADTASQGTTVASVSSEGTEAPGVEKDSSGTKPDVHKEYESTTSQTEQKSPVPEEQSTEHSTEKSEDKDHSQQPIDHTEPIEFHEKHPTIESDATTIRSQEASQTDKPYTTQAAIQVEIDDSEITTIRVHEHAVTDDHQVEFTTKHEEITTPHVIDEGENEISEDDHKYPDLHEPPRIPGEGSCLIDGITYNNHDSIPTTNKCQTLCKCVDSVVKCEHVKCSPPPPNMKNCKAVYHTKEACCPMYTCEHEEPNIIESDNQMSQEWDHPEKEPSQRNKTSPHEAVEEPIDPSVYKPDCSSDSGCEIQTQKPIADSVTPKESISSQEPDVEKKTETPFGEKQSEQPFDHDTVTQSIDRTTVRFDADQKDHERSTTSPEEDGAKPEITTAASQEIFDTSSVKLRDEITTIAGDTQDFTLRPVVDGDIPVVVDKSTTILDDRSSQTTIKPKIDSTTVSIDDVNKIGVSVLPTDSVDDIEPQVPSKDCEDKECTAQAHFTRYPLDKSPESGPTTPSAADVQKCGPHGCEDDEQNAIGLDELEKPLCGPNGCIPETKPIDGHQTSTPSLGDRSGEDSKKPMESDQTGKPTEKSVEPEQPGKPTEIPVETEKPGKPSETPVETEQPGKPTEIPVETEQPGKPSEIPVETEQPGKPTEIPVETEQPGKPSEIPVETEQPGKPSEIPVETELLGESSEKPVKSDIPDLVELTTVSDASESFPITPFPPKEDNKDETCEGDSCSVESESTTSEKPAEEPTKPVPSGDSQTPEISSITPEVPEVTTAQHVHETTQQSLTDKDQLQIDATSETPHDVEPTEKRLEDESSTSVKPDDLQEAKPHDHLTDVPTTTRTKLEDQEKQTPGSETISPDEMVHTTARSVIDEKSESVDVIKATTVSEDEDKSHEITTIAADVTTVDSLKSEEDRIPEAHTTSTEGKPSETPLDVSDKPATSSRPDQYSTDVESTTVYDGVERSTPIVHDQTTSQKVEDLTEQPSQKPDEHPSHDIHTTIESLGTTESSKPIETQTTAFEEKTKRPQVIDDKPSEHTTPVSTDEDDKSPEVDIGQEPIEHYSEKQPVEVDTQKPVDLESTLPAHKDDDITTVQPIRDRTDEPEVPTPVDETQTPKTIDIVGTHKPALPISTEHPEKSDDEKDVTTVKYVESSDVPKHDEHVTDRASFSTELPVAKDDVSSVSAQEPFAHSTPEQTIETTTAPAHVDEHSSEEKDYSTTSRTVESTASEEDETKHFTPDLTKLDDKEQTTKASDKQEGEEHTKASIDEETPHDATPEGITHKPSVEPKKSTTSLFTTRSSQRPTTIQIDYDSDESTEKPHSSEEQSASMESFEHSTRAPVDEMEISTEVGILSDKKQPEISDHTLDVTEKKPDEKSTEQTPVITTVQDQERIDDRFTTDEEAKPVDQIPHSSTKTPEVAVTTAQPQHETTQAHVVSIDQDHSTPVDEGTTIRTRDDVPVHEHTKEHDQETTTIASRIKDASPGQYETTPIVQSEPTVQPQSHTTIYDHGDEDVSDELSSVKPHERTSIHPDISHEEEPSASTTARSHVETTVQQQAETTVESHIDDRPHIKDITHPSHIETTIAPDFDSSEHLEPTEKHRPEVTAQQAETTIQPLESSSVFHEQTSEPTHAETPGAHAIETTLKPHPETTVGIDESAEPTEKPFAETTIRAETDTPHLDSKLSKPSSEKPTPSDEDVKSTEEPITEGTSQADHDSKEEATSPHPHEEEHKPDADDLTHEVDIEPHVETTIQPHAETTAQPQEEVTVQRQAETTAHPHAETTAQPQEDVTVQRQAETTAHPHAETTAQPQEDVTVQRQAETTAHPHAETTAQPQEDVTVQRQAETTAHPHAETTAQPQEDVTVQRQAETTAHPHAETTAQPQEDVTVQRQAETTAHPHAETTAQPQEDVTVQRQAETTAHPHAETTAQPQEDVTVQRQAETTAHPHAETTAQPQEDVTVQRQAETTAHPHAETTAQPQEDVTVQRQAETTAHPHAETTAQPQEDVTVQRQAETTAHPHAETTAQPQEDVTVQRQAETTAQPQEDVTVQRQAETTAHAHAETTAQPQEDVTVQRQAETTAHPHAETTAQPQEEVTVQRQAETTAQPHELTTLSQEEVTVQRQAETTATPQAEFTVRHQTVTTAQPQEDITAQHIETTPQTPVKSTTDYIIDYITSKIPFIDSSTSKPTTSAEEEPDIPSIPSEGQHEEQAPDFTGSYGPTATDTDYDEEETFGPGTCRYGGKIYVSAQQIPRDDPCDFCFCFRSDIICLQQSCPPPIQHCHEEPIQGFCCPRYECPVSMATVMNVTTTTTTTTTTLPPHFLSHAYKGQAQKRGCQIDGHVYKVGEVIKQTSGPCLQCICGADGQMKCDPKKCTPEPMLRQMIAVAATQRRRR